MLENTKKLIKTWEDTLSGQPVHIPVLQVYSTGYTPQVTVFEDENYVAYCNHVNSEIETVYDERIVAGEEIETKMKVRVCLVCDAQLIFGEWVNV